ncbi:MAG: 2-C-methyl-D-erythritol 4-phosphate cytidylyltransferase [Betaproteobacteria bacterium]|jgi:2-C-methyl-D-erythritol 4-phosphate cytidylyltransferase|nr:MAG: 2-C-methyl-D-erythritol 4-phosphate cytidylyltransferase [Betaproteobacteria bacterium]
MPRYVALIPAAGTGSRFGNGRPKQYLDLLGKPMLAYSVEALARHPRISTVMVVISPDDTWFQQFDWDVSGVKLQFHRVGGATRAQSVRNGLEALDDEVGADDWVLVHDAARPCLATELLDRLIEGVGDDAIGGLLAVRIADTLKSADESNRVASTQSREGLWGAQTPQMFRRSLIERAMREMQSADVTDESSAVEWLGFQPLLIESSVENLKVTFPADRQLAETILKARMDGH